jgi:hypothetical protein
MTQDDIIRMAREAGLFTHKEVQPELIAFANLVAAAKAEVALAEAYRCGAAAEREACAKVCEAQGEYGWQQYAAAIRARSQT